MHDKKYIFGYGSLVSIADVARTLGHPVELIYPFTLNGWIRDWSVVVDNATSHRRLKLVASGEAPEYIAALNVRRPAAGERATNPNGVLFEVTDADLEMLDKRECNYARQDVTNDVVGWSTGTVFAYTGLERCLSAQNVDLVVIIPSSYFDLVIQGFASLGPDMHETYISSTLVSSLPVHASVLL